MQKSVLAEISCSISIVGKYNKPDLSIVRLKHSKITFHASRSVDVILPLGSFFFPQLFHWNSHIWYFLPNKNNLKYLFFQVKGENHARSYTLTWGNLKNPQKQPKLQCSKKDWSPCLQYHGYTLLNRYCSPQSREMMSFSYTKKNKNYKALNSYVYPALEVIEGTYSNKF